MNRIMLGLGTIVLGLMALALGLRIWTVGDSVRTNHSVQFGESTISLSYIFMLFVFFALVALIAFVNTWRRKSDAPDKLRRAKSGKRGRAT